MTLSPGIMYLNVYESTKQAKRLYAARACVDSPILRRLTYGINITCVLYYVLCLIIKGIQNNSRYVSMDKFIGSGDL